MFILLPGYHFGLNMKRYASVRFGLFPKARVQCFTDSRLLTVSPKTSDTVHYHDPGHYMGPCEYYSTGVFSNSENFN